jgi:hypothetical protein
MTTTNGTNNPRPVAPPPPPARPTSRRPASPQPTTSPEPSPAKPPPPPPSLQATIFSGIARGVALFIGLFTVLNLAIAFRSGNFDSNTWWINLNPLANRAPLLARLALAFAALLLLAFALLPQMSRRRRRVTRITLEILALFIVYNIWSFYRQLRHGWIHTTAPVPMSLFIGLALALIWRAAASQRQPGGPSAWLAMLFTTAALAIAVPLLQMLCFGSIEYTPGVERPYDAAIVFGPGVYSDGEPAEAFTDRINRAVALYKDGKVSKIIICAAPPPPGTFIDQTDSLRYMALEAGVHPKDLVPQPASLITDAAIHDDLKLAIERIREQDPDRPLQLAVISQFYNLPRLNMRFREARYPVVYPLPVRKPLPGTFTFTIRELGATWKYYVEALLG